MMPSRAAGGVLDERAVPRRDGRDRRVQGEEPAQARQVLGHVPVGRGDDHRRPLHDVVPGEEHALLDEQPAQVVRGVARGVQRPGA